MIRYVPNSLTIFRLLALPVFFWLYGTQVPGIAWKATILMSIAALTDVADGHIARRFNVTSEFGRILAFPPTSSTGRCRGGRPRRCWLATCFFFSLR
jgi:hypothetical protein